jgi:hypothetical protein
MRLQLRGPRHQKRETAKQSDRQDDEENDRNG